MSEKRFIYGETIDYNFFDVFEEKKYLGMIQRDSTKIVDRLNELSEENEQLRQSIKELQRSRDYWIQDNNRLTKKNNELIAKIDFLERVIDGDV